MAGEIGSVGDLAAELAKNRAEALAVAKLQSEDAKETAKINALGKGGVKAAEASMVR